MGCGYKGWVFCRSNGWILENKDKGLTVPKWVLIVWPKIPQMPQNLSAQFVCPSPKVLDFNEKRLHWVSADIEIITSYLGTRWFNKLEAFSNCPFLYMIVPSLGGSSEGMKCVHTINYQNQKSVHCHSSTIYCLKWLSKTCLTSAFWSGSIK